MKSGPVCGICPHACSPAEGSYGICNARIRQQGEIRCANYGLITSIALDPIEKKPLHRFLPGSRILSVGSFGCNLFCPFCQNHSIARASISNAQTTYISPQMLVDQALSLRSSGNIGIAFTYNEPLVGYEYVLDTAVLAKANNLKTVVVTNGYINEEPLRRLLPYIDAMNIDVKASDDEAYQRLGGHLAPVRRAVLLASGSCHVEVTSLIVPGLCDTESSMRETASWLSSIRSDIPLHVTRFFPRYKMDKEKATPVETIMRLTEVAGEYLQYVYPGNI